jgi:gliding motility-associated-like protein
MNLIKRLFVTLTAAATIATASASHVPGGNITYECVGPNQYLVTLTLFEDCGTAFTGNYDEYLTLTNDCGLASPSVTLPNIVYQQEMSQLCPAQIGNSECNGGTLPGIWMHQWQAVVTLPGPCDSWTFAYSSCCRNTSVNVSGQPGYYWESILNSATAPCNTSPIVTAQPIPYVCLNQAVNYNLSAYEPDGNTLVYTLIGAQSAAGTFVPYNAGYSAAAPIPGMVIDPATGQISFTPTSTGNYIVAVLIEEYDAAGNLVGSIIHDIQFEVINCTNVNPNIPAAGIQNYVGQGGQIAPNAVEVCEGDSFCFDVVFDDPDATNVLTVTSNVGSVLPGATISQTGTNPVTATVCWTAVPGQPNFNSFVFTVEDDGCPINGMATFPVEVHIISSTYAGANVTMCQGVPTQLNASGGTSFNWTVISGDPIVLGTNFSCNPCQNPIVNPSVTTTYQVVSNLTGGCNNIDTIVVTVVPDFTYTITQSSGTSCLLDPIQFTITPSPAGAYTYAWTPSVGLSSTTASSPVFTATAPGTYTFDVTITSPVGCVKQDQTTVVAASAYAPNITAFVDLDTIQCGDQVQLGVDLGGGIPASCGASLTGCTGTLSTMTTGPSTGSNTSTTYPAPYGNWYANEKHQFLFTAAELNAMGFIGGKISEIGWQITAMGGISTYPDYTIKMGCTSQTNLTTTFIPGLTTVYGPQNTTVAVGWNMHTLATPYEWDGVSNLVVEICYTWTAQYSYTTNCVSPWQNTTHTSSSWYNSDGTAACPELSGWSTANTRPITRFVHCPSIPDPNDYSFSWTPASGPNGVSNATIQDPTAQPYFTTWYVVTVTDINGGCTDVDSVMVFTDCCDPSNVMATDATCNGASDGFVSTTPLGNNGPFDIEILSGGISVYTNTGVLQNQTDISSGLPAGTYTVLTTDQTLCIHDTVVIISEPPVVTVATTDTTICLAGTATLIAQGAGGDGGPYTYNWIGQGTGTPTVTPVLNTCYDVYVTDATGCSSDTIQMCVNLLPSLTATASAAISGECPGVPLTVDGTAAGGNGGPYTYNWYLQGGSSVGTGASANVTPVNPGNPESDFVSTYCIIVNDGCETPNDTACVDLTTFAVPNVTFTSDITDGCYPVEVSFTNTTNPAFTGTCFWQFGDGSTGNICDTTVTYYSPGMYTVSLTVTSPNGCVADTVANGYISVYDYPEASYSYNPQVGTVLNSEITFTNTSVDNTYNLWTFGTDPVLGTSNDVNPVHVFPINNPGTYEVSLYVENQYGCADSTSQFIVIEGIFTLYVPNAFTPDGDGLNELFMPMGEGAEVDNFKFLIYDRWGELIFTATEPGVGWDGTFRNFPAKTDVYVWKIYATDRFTGQKLQFDGHVTLIR